MDSPPEATGTKGPQRRRRIGEKESWRWVGQSDLLQGTFRDGPQTTFIDISDREGGIHGLLQNRRYGHIHYIVRSRGGCSGQGAGHDTFPNPANEVVNIGFNGLEGQPVMVEVYDQLGRAILVRELKAGENSLTIGLEDGLKKSGVYTVLAKGKPAEGANWPLLKQRLVIMR